MNLCAHFYGCLLALASLSLGDMSFLMQSLRLLMRFRHKRHNDGMAHSCLKKSLILFTGIGLLRGHLLTYFLSLSLHACAPCVEDPHFMHTCNPFQQCCPPGAWLHPDCMFHPMHLGSPAFVLGLSPCNSFGRGVPLRFPHPFLPFLDFPHPLPFPYPLLYVLFPLPFTLPFPFPFHQFPFVGA